ncbi:MAG: gliding motility-associated C-terminal domain-containing protein [Burkholderiales bacterium]|nr:gliding motility-associated C-terminal domain-containing protein [Bacteroidia bacterium]
MKKNALLIILLATIIVAKAQTILLNNQSYQNLKATGKLIHGANYKIINSPGNASHSNAPDLTLGLSSAKTNSTGACQCMVPVDPTFTLVPMAGLISPYRNDDGSSNSIPLGFSFCFYGTTYNSCFINNNGNISFGSSYSSFSSNPFPDPSFVMVAPFWGDVDTRDPASGLVYFKKTATALIVKWSNVGYYSMMSDKLNDFQLIITDGSNPILPNGNNIAFCYGDMQWTTGSASSGVGGFGGVPSTVGVNKGDGINFVQIGRFDQPGGSYDGPYGLNDGVSFLDYKSYFFNSCGTNNNLPPIIQDATGGGSACGDTIRICSLGDTLVYTTTFLAPEGTQSITVNGSAPTLGTNFQPLSVTTSSAGTTTYAWMVVASPTLTGVHTVVITGTDNGTPPLSSSATYFIKIQNLVVPQPTLTSSPGGTVCATPGATLTLTNCSSYDNVYWSNGGSGCSTLVNSTGVYFVTVKKTGCFKSSSDTIVVFPNPVPVVFGPLNYCFPTTSTTLSINAPSSGMPAYNSYTWSPGPINTPTAALTSGVNTVTVTDVNGCKGSATFTISSASPTVGIAANPASICGTGTSTLTASISGATSYSWSNGATAQTMTVNVGGVYSLTVEANNCIATKTINVNISPTPTVTIPVSLGMCSGANATVSVTSFSPAGAYTYTWSNGSNASSLIIATNTVVSVQVTNTVSGCVSLASNSCTIAAATNPTVNMSAVPVNFCNGFNATLTTTVTGGSPLYTYSWSPASLGTDSSAVTANAGTYSVMVTDQNLCVGSATVIAVKSTPTVTLSSPDLNICPGECAEITAVGTSSFIPFTYSWSNSAAFISDSTIICNGGPVSIVFTDGLGCIATSTIIVIANVTPTVTIPVTVSMCAGFSSTVAATSFSPAGAYSYTWSNGANTNSLTVSTPIVLTLQVTNTVTGCQSAVSNSCSVITVSNPTVNMSALPVVFCSGFNAALTPTITGGTPLYSYSWTPSTLGSASTATTSNTGIYSLLVIDQNLCRGSSTVAVVKSTPSVLLSSPDLVICPGDCAEITATGTSSFSPFSYSWSSSPSIGDSSLACSAGPVQVTFTDAKGCIATATITVFDDVIPVASFTANPSSPVNPGQVIDFTSTSTIASGSITSTTWSFGDGNGANGTQVSYAYSNAGTFLVTITVSGSSGCTNSFILNYTVDAIIEIPNVFTPNGDNINDYLKFKYLDVFGSNNLSIFNRWGNKVFEKDNYNNDWNGGGHTDGTYFFILSVPDAKPNIYKGYFQLMR